MSCLSFISLFCPDLAKVDMYIFLRKYPFKIICKIIPVLDGARHCAIPVYDGVKHGIILVYDSVRPGVIDTM